ncbi:MAG: long-chain-acyl-CoA synthetase [Candidatus Hodarchaeota archaeon]
MSPKETEFYNRFIRDLASVNEDPNHSFGFLIEKWAEEIPNNIALYFQDDTWTWQAFNDESNKISNFFLNSGLNHGECIALMLENSPESLFLTSGINKIQGISALVNFNQKKQALSHSFKIVNPKYIVIDGDNLHSFYEIAENLPLKNDQIFVVNNKKDIPHDFMDLPSELKSISISNPKAPDDTIMENTALYIYTSGTTGLPKAVIMANVKIFTQGFFLGSSLTDLTPKDIVYIPTPLYHNLSIGCAWIGALLSGAGTALRKRFSASEFWKDIKKYQATYTIYVGEIPRYLLNQPESEYEKNTPLKKMVGLGLRKDIWEKFKARFNVEHIYEFYGSTEGHYSLINIDEVPGMVGRNNMVGLVLAKCDPDTGELYKNQRGFCIKCKPGDVGMAMLKVDKKSVFRGYRDKEKTQKKMITDVFRKTDCYFNTGDMLQLHDDLWISFYDRFGDTFRWKSENVSTLEVEAILNSYPSVLISAVYGVAIPNTEGKAGMAAIKLHDLIKFDIVEFSQFITEVLPKYAIPVFIRIRDELELTGPMKIKKVNLRKEAYEIDKIKDPLYFWDSRNKKYAPFSKVEYNDLLEGKIRM